MSDDLDPHTAQLTEENARLRAQIAALRGVPEGVPGKKIVWFFVATIALAFATALTLFAMAKRTLNARREAERVVHPTLSRVDATGHSLTHAIAECVAEAPADTDQTIKVRVKLAPTGQLALLNSEVAPNDEQLIQCVRRAPTLVHVAEGDSGSTDIEVRYATSVDADGTHVLKTAWVAKQPGER